MRVAFKAFDPHELLCHALAVHTGAYADEGLEPHLLDATFTPDADLPDDAVLVACGSALQSHAQGVAMRVVLAACERPMFWLCARRPAAGARGAVVSDPGELPGRPVATFPAPAPPALLLRAALRARGIDPDGVDLRPARDDAARLGLLRAGEVDAALVSSACLPLDDLPGVAPILDVGAELRVPTTGIAITAAAARERPELAGAAVRAHRRALAALHGDDAATTAALVHAFGWSESRARRALATLRARLTTDGRVDAAAVRPGADAFAAELPGNGAVDADALYAPLDGLAA